MAENSAARFARHVLPARAGAHPVTVAAALSILNDNDDRMDASTGYIWLGHTPFYVGPEDAEAHEADLAREAEKRARYAAGQADRDLLDARWDEAMAQIQQEYLLEVYGIAVVYEGEDAAAYYAALDVAAAHYAPRANHHWRRCRAFHPHVRGAECASALHLRSQTDPEKAAAARHRANKAAQHVATMEADASAIMARREALRQLFSGREARTALHYHGGDLGDLTGLASVTGKGVFCFEENADMSAFYTEPEQAEDLPDTEVWADDEEDDIFAIDDSNCGVYRYPALIREEHGHWCHGNFFAVDDQLVDGPRKVPAARNMYSSHGRVCGLWLV